MKLPYTDTIADLTALFGVRSNYFVISSLPFSIFLAYQGETKADSVPRWKSFQKSKAFHAKLVTETAGDVTANKTKVREEKQEMQRADLAPFTPTHPWHFLPAADNSLKQTANLKGSWSASRSWCTDRYVRRSGHAARSLATAHLLSCHLLQIPDGAHRLRVEILQKHLGSECGIRENGVLAVALTPYYGAFFFEKARPYYSRKARVDKLYGESLLEHDITYSYNGELTTCTNICFFTCSITE